MLTTEEKFEVPEADREIIDIWFPEGLPDPNDSESILLAWSGISLRLAVMPFEMFRDGKYEITPEGVDRIRRTMAFLQIGWTELEEGAALAISESVKYLRASVPDVPETTIQEAV